MLIFGAGETPIYGLSIGGLAPRLVGILIGGGVIFY